MGLPHLDTPSVRNVGGEKGYLVQDALGRVEQVEPLYAEYSNVLPELTAGRGGAGVRGIARLDLDDHPLSAHLDQQVGSDVVGDGLAVHPHQAFARELAFEDTVTLRRQPTFGERFARSGAAHLTAEKPSFPRTTDREGDPGDEGREEEGGYEN